MLRVMRKSKNEGGGWCVDWTFDYRDSLTVVQCVPTNYNPTIIPRVLLTALNEQFEKDNTDWNDFIKQFGIGGFDFVKLLGFLRKIMKSNTAFFVVDLKNFKLVAEFKKEDKLNDEAIVKTCNYYSVIDLERERYEVVVFD